MRDLLRSGCETNSSSSSTEKKRASSSEMLIRLEGSKLPPEHEERPEEARRRQIMLIVQSQKNKSRRPLTEPLKHRSRPSSSSLKRAKMSITTTIVTQRRLLNVACLAIVLSILQASQQLATCSMCQHHQAMLQEAVAKIATSAALAGGETPATSSNQVPGPQQQQHQNLIVCPKSSQFNDMPQFPSRYLSPSLERQQRHILQHLNASFANHLQRRSSPSAALPSAAAPASLDDQQEGTPVDTLIDDQLLNEIISPLVVDAAYERAKELIVKRRKFENELVRQGEFSLLLELAL